MSVTSAGVSKIVGPSNVVEGEPITVRPQTADQVQTLIEFANRTSTALVPVSSGPPHFRGSTVPSVAHAVLVDLSDLNRIIRIDRRNRVAMIEPGVTFSTLIPELAKADLRLNMPLFPRPNKSVVASALDREPVMMPLHQWDAIDPLTCVGVVFGRGERFSTGSAAGPGTIEQQWGSGQAQVNPMGPGQTDLARVLQGSQGTLGIVTWATIKCEAMPTRRKAFLFGSDQYDDLARLVRRMLWLKFGDECLILNKTDLAAILADSPKQSSEIKAALPQWTLLFCLAGYHYSPDQRLAYQEKQVREEAAKLGLEPSTSLAGIDGEAFRAMLASPAGEPHWKSRPRGAFRDIFFLTTLDRASQFFPIVSDVAKKHGYSPEDLGTYIQPMVQGTSCQCEFSLFSDQTDVTRVDAICREATQALMDAGGFFSRPYGVASDIIYSGSADTVSALKKVKQIFDPSGIMNPGKLCF